MKVDMGVLVREVKNLELAGRDEWNVRMGVDGLKAILETAARELVSRKGWRIVSAIL